ncbi:hypothetical protein [Prevotella nigrescens]|uniref:hypothetical protein n=1 Tax=Prevotella nigrescens TaxID=28133 RepID=UPI00288ABE25|nr:hypothetical protein [Prevotella nigrescens]
MNVNYKLLMSYSKLPNKTENRAVIVENQKIGLRQMADNIKQNMLLMSADIVAASPSS